MRTSRHRIACLLTAALLAAPASAWGQSAGDEQYEDPFGGGGGGGGGQQQPAPEEAPAAPAPAPAPESEPAPAGEPVPPASEAPAAAPPAATASAREQLPYTGAEAGLLAAGGVLLLGGGVALRLRLREQS